MSSLAKERKVFFFEKKNQKTFAHGARVGRQVRDSTIKSLFASFSSEKEGPFPIVQTAL
jgi:hypothetical protein